MTAKTRRRLVVCFVAVALTLPVETILLRAVSTSTTQEAADWAASLTDDQIPAAAAQIQSLPFAYRRALMGRMAPQARAAVWQNHIKGYIAAHASLDASTVALLYNAASLVTADALSYPSSDVRAQMTSVAEQTKVLLGADETDYLFYRLGPKDVTLASALPLGQQLTNFVRTHFIVQATIEDCDCSTSFGCDAPSHCDGAQTCTKFDSWPACGWFWNSECNGLCMLGMDG